MNFHLPGYVQESDGLTDRECKVYVTFYTAKPYRIDVQMNGLFMLPNNARWMGDQIEWERPRRDKHLPTLQVRIDYKRHFTTTLYLCRLSRHRLHYFLGSFKLLNCVEQRWRYPPNSIFRHIFQIQ